MKDVRELIRELGRRGTTVFLSSHLLHEVEQVCNRAVIINKGRTVIEGPVSALRPKGNAVKVLTSDQARAEQVLADLLGADKVAPDEEYLMVTADDGSVPELVRRLVAAQLDVHAVVPAHEQGLEDFFLELTQSGDVDSGRAPPQPPPRRRRRRARHEKPRARVPEDPRPEAHLPRLGRPPGDPLPRGAGPLPLVLEPAQRGGGPALPRPGLQQRHVRAPLGHGGAVVVSAAAARLDGGRLSHSRRGRAGDDEDVALASCEPLDRPLLEMGHRHRLRDHRHAARLGRRSARGRHRVRAEAAGDHLWDDGQHLPRRVADLPYLRPHPVGHDVSSSRWPCSSRRSPTPVSRPPSSRW